MNKLICFSYISEKKNNIFQIVIFYYVILVCVVNKMQPLTKLSSIRIQLIPCWEFMGRTSRRKTDVVKSSTGGAVNRRGDLCAHVKDTDLWSKNNKKKLSRKHILSHLYLSSHSKMYSLTHILLHFTCNYNTTDLLSLISSKQWGKMAQIERRWSLFIEYNRIE